MRQDESLFLSLSITAENSTEHAHRHNDHHDADRVLMRQLRRHLVQKYEEAVKRMETAMDEGITNEHSFTDPNLISTTFIFKYNLITSAERKRNKETVDLLETKIANLTLRLELFQQIVQENNQGKSQKSRSGKIHCRSTRKDYTNIQKILGG